VLTERLAIIAIDATVEAVEAVFARDPDAVAITLLYGATHIDQLLRRIASPPMRDHIIPIITKRTQGNDFNRFVQVELPYDFKDASRYIIVDDLRDGGASHDAVVSAIHTRARTRNPIIRYTYDSTSSPVDITHALREHDIMSFTPITKNPTRSIEIAELTANDQPPMADIIRLQLAHTRLVDAGEWIMGQGIDTGIKGSELRTAVLTLRPDLATLPNSMAQLNLLERTLVRAGQGSSTIIALNEGIDYQAFLTTYATIFAHELQGS
jgi:hypothetical protein